MKHIYTLIAIFLFIGTGVFAQDPTGNHPCDAKPFCSDSTYNFPNVTGQPHGTGVQGPNYGCLGTQPNQIWYYMRIGTAGTIQITMTQTSATNAPLDLDFAMWGPFADLEDGCDSVINGLAPLQCSYSASYTETIGIGMPGGSGSGQSTPPPAQVGEYYIVVLTNYSNQPGSIDFNQTGGTGATDCSIVYCNLTVGNNGPVCAGSPVELWAQNDTAVNWEWRDPNDNIISTNQNTTTTWNQAGNFTYKMTSIIGEDTCIASTVVTFLPSTFDTTRVEICSGESYDFQGERYYQEGVYPYTFTAQSGCDSILVLDLTVNPLPPAEISGPSSYDFCEGDNITIRLSEELPNSTFQWFRNSSPIPGETGSSLKIDTDGNYHVEIESNKGCSSISKTIQVTVHENPEVYITKMTEAVLCTYDTIDMTAHSSIPAEFYWEPDYVFRNTTGNQFETVKGVFIEGSEEVVVRAVTAFGCSGTDTMKVYAEPCCDVNVPSAFTPDGDGLNDKFNPILQPTQKVVRFEVYDRYGQLLHNASSGDIETNLGWNGNYPNGEQAKMDSYMYVLEYTCADGKNYIKKGSVTLVR